MSNDSDKRMYTVEQAMTAQKALRRAAGSGEELFPIQAFVGMMSDEIEALYQQGMTDTEIADLIEANSDIKITASDLAHNYASPEQRRRG